ncbi:hypothetical protein [Allohahella marinimesophila]|uniref:Uncharacterized protein n=1 Tax=Allohahella marinimesophila TaxID=1054972 RepID=A0ABP7Q823_9GAMM
MNRAEKEMAKKHAEERKGLSEAEYRQLDLAEALGRKVHYEMFPEEYDFKMDSISDAKDRRRGKNPMSSEYTDKVNARRKELGVSPLGTNGMPTDNSSEEAARQEALRRLG